MSCLMMFNDVPKTGQSQGNVYLPIPLAKALILLDVGLCPATWESMVGT